MRNQLRFALLAFAGTEALGLVVPASTDQAARVRVSHILVDSEEMAQTAIRTVKEGTPFAQVAEALSACDSRTQGGDLGWIAPGLMVPEFDLVAFNFEPGELATLQTEFGWHVVNVVERSFVEPEMEPTELRERIEAGDAIASPPTLQLIDLRDDEELAQAPLLPGFRNLQYKDWQTWAPEAIEGKLDPPLEKGLETVFMDHRGGRGERMMQYLCQNGFTSARFVRGGINAYAEEADPRVPTYLESDGDCTTCHEH